MDRHPVPITLILTHCPRKANTRPFLLSNSTDVDAETTCRHLAFGSGNHTDRRAGGSSRKVVFPLIQKRSRIDKVLPTHERPSIARLQAFRRTDGEWTMGGFIVDFQMKHIT